MEARTNQHRAAASPPTSPCLCPSTPFPWIHPRRIWKVCTWLCAPLVQYEHTALQSSVCVPSNHLQCHVHHQIGDDDLLLPSYIMAYLVESLMRSACTHDLHTHANTRTHVRNTRMRNYNIHTSTSYICVHTYSGTYIGSPLNRVRCSYI